MSAVTGGTRTEFTRPGVWRASAAWLVSIVLVSAFGPYLSVSMGLRLEHVVIYGLTPVAVARLLLGARTFALQPPMLWVALWWTTALVWTLAVTFLYPGYERNSVVAAVENYMQPIAVVLLMAAFLPGYDDVEARGLIRWAFSVLLGLLVVNTLLAVASMFFDMTLLGAHFAGAKDAAGWTTWARARTMGRFTGVFNQPMESGLAYSLGLLVWSYWARTGDYIGGRGYTVLMLLIVGGALSVSKVFILGGLPLFAAHWGMQAFRIDRPKIVVGLATVIVLAWLLSSWSGAAFLLRLFEMSGGGGFVELYTAGRFGVEDSLVQTLFARTWLEVPLQGYGFAVEAILDSGYLEFFLQGGSVAGIAYLAVLAGIAWVAFSGYPSAPEEGRLLVAILLLTIAAGIGAPVLTINRYSTVFWVIFSLLSYAILRHPTEDESINSC